MRPQVLVCDLKHAAQTGQLIAEYAVYSCVTVVLNAEYSATSVKVKREVEGGAIELIEAPFPADLQSFWTDIASTVDSALVEGEVASGESDLWLGSTPATRLRLVTQSGQLNRHVVWDRLAVQYAPGTYVDSIIVTLQRDPSIKAVFVDTLEVVAVQLPEPIAAVDELFQAGQLTDDQRALFDRDGNRNGAYDLGDFLAWVDRAHLRLSPEAASRLQGLMVKEPPPAPGKRPLR